MATAWRYEIDDLISQIEDPMDLLLQFRNVESIEAYGGEIEVTRSLPAGALVRFAFTHQMTRDETTGRELTNAPDCVLHAALAVPLFRKRADLALQGRYLSGRRTLADDRTGGEAVLDLTFNSRDLWPWLDLQVGIRNLFDRDYSDPGSGEHLQDLIPQDGRTYFVGVRRRF